VSDVMETKIARDCVAIPFIGIKLIPFIDHAVARCSGDFLYQIAVSLFNFSDPSLFHLYPVFGIVITIVELFVVVGASASLVGRDSESPSATLAEARHFNLSSF